MSLTLSALYRLLTGYELPRPMAVRPDLDENARHYRALARAGSVAVELEGRRRGRRAVRGIDFRFLLALGLGTVFVVAGVLARAGRWRRWTSRYFDSDLPFYLRNTGLVLVPLGTIFLCFAGAGLLMSMRGPIVWVGLALLGAAILAFTCSSILMYRPPRWLKPGWLLEEEARRGTVSEPRGILAAVDFLILIFLLGLGGITLLSLVLLVSGAV